jgi:ATP-dependent Clp protease ATP-binding subunit ClpA
MSEVIPFPITPRLRQALFRANLLAARAHVERRVDVDHLFLALESQSGSPVRAMVHAAGYDVAELWAAFRGTSRVRLWHEELAEDEFIGGTGI